MFPILQLGPLAIQVPGLVLLTGVWVGLSLAEREAARLRLKPDAVYSLAFTGLIAGVIGARLVYVARYFSAYAADPLGIILPNPATLAAAEGFLIGIIAAAIYGARRKLPLRPTLDALAPAIALMMAAIALAHIASGDAFGSPARLPWSVYLWDDYRHPSQIYEWIGALIVLGVWRRLRGRPSFPGFAFLLVVALSATARIFLEAFRGDSLLTVGGIRSAQLWGMASLAASLAAMKIWAASGDAVSNE